MPSWYAVANPAANSSTAAASSGGRAASGSSGAPSSKPSGNASSWRVTGRQNRPTSTSPVSMPAGTAASSGPAALAGWPSDPVYGTISDSAPVSSEHGSHSASSSPRTVASPNSTALPAIVARTTPRPERDAADRAERGRRRKRTRADSAIAQPASSSNCRAGSSTSTAPPMPRPRICVPDEVRLSTDLPSTYRSPSSTSGSTAAMAALNTGAVVATTATSTSMSTTGMPGTSPISTPGAARMSKPPVITVRGGSRSASEVSSAPPTACGANPAPNASAAQNADLVCAYTTTDRPRISNSNPIEYTSSPVSSTRNSRTARTDRYVVVTVIPASLGGNHDKR